MLRRPLIAASFAIPFLLGGCGEAPPPDPRTQAPLVRTAVVTTGETTARAFTGTVAARVQSDLGFRVPGKVLERLVDTGQTVRRGQLLMRIDPVDLQLAASSQRDSVDAAKARAKQASDEEARYRDLRGTGAVSVSAYDQAKAAADAAQAQLRAAQAQADVAGNSTQYARLLADVDGVVMETLAEPGQVVGAGQVVVRIARTGKREAVIQMPETMRPAIGSSAQATLFGREGASAPARLRQLSEVADRTTRTFEARYVLEGDLAQAPIGTTVTVRLADTAPASNVFRVPVGAISDQGQGPLVWWIDGTKVTRKPVAVAQVADEFAYVTGPLRAGDRIVALGAHLLREGMPVRVAEQAAQSAPTASAAPAGAVRE